MRAFLRRHTGKLLVIEATPQSVAAGAAVGIFLGFTPLLGTKTLLAIAVAALLRVSKVAAAIAVIRPGVPTHCSVAHTHRRRCKFCTDAVE